MTNSTVKVDLITVNTNKTEKSIKSLKSQIKDLRLELETLDEGTAEYNATLEKLAALTHQQTELSETIRRANTDYGNTLTILTKSANGVIASFSIINSLMGIMGNESSSAEEAMRKTLQYMQLIQGLSSLDEAEKSFSELFSRLKKNIFARKEDTIETEQNTLAQQKNTNALNANANAVVNQSNALSKSNGKVKILTNGVKGLWGALKSFVVSNPFTLLIAGITTAITLFSRFRAEAQEARLEAEKAITDNLVGISENNSRDTQQNSFSNSHVAKDYYNIIKETNKELKENKDLNSKIYEQQRGYDKEYIANETERLNKEKERLENRKLELDQYTEEEKKKEPFMKEWEEYNNNLIDNYKEQIALNQRNYYSLKQYLNGLEKDTKEYNQALEDLKRTEEAITKLSETDLLKSYQEIDKVLSQRTANEKENNEKAQENADKYYQSQIDKLNEWLELELLRNERWHNEGIKSNKKYYTDLITIREEYYNKLEALDTKNPKITEKDLINATNEVLNARKQLAQYELDFAKLNENDKTLFISADEAKALKRNTERIAQDIKEIEDKRNMLSTLSTREAYNLIQKWNIKTEEQEYAHLDKMLAIEQEYYEEQRAIITRKYEEQKTIDEANQYKQLDELKYKVEKGLLDTEEAIEMRKKIISDFSDAQKQLQYDYLISTMEINEQQMNTEYEYSLARINIAENEIQRKIELQELYYNSLSTVYGNISTLLGTVQSMYDENSKQYKNIARTQIIADGISTSVSAYKSGVSSGLPAPANLIYGGVLAGITTANTLLQLHNLEAERISNTSTTSAVSNIGSSTYETLAYTTLKDINGNIRDSKVYVVENEIQQVANRVHIYENESVF